MFMLNVVLLVVLVVVVVVVEQVPLRLLQIQLYL
jgi:hypothetical protein